MLSIAAGRNRPKMINISHFFALQALEERKKQAMRTISQLQDYQSEIESQRIQNALFEAACQESEVCRL